MVWLSEIMVDTILIAFLASTVPALFLAILIEVICLGFHFGSERIWNRIHWGREIHISSSDEKKSL